MIYPNTFTDPYKAPHPVEVKYKATGLQDISPAEMNSYGQWVRDTWPADALRVMWNRPDDSTSQRGHELYNGVVFRRAVQIRTTGSLNDIDDTDPGSFSDSAGIDPNGKLLSADTQTIAQFDAAKQASVKPWYSPSVLAAAWNDRMAQIGKAFGLGIDASKWLAWGVAAVLGLGLVWYFILRKKL